MVGVSSLRFTHFGKRSFDYKFFRLPLVKTGIIWHTCSVDIGGDGSDSESHQAYHLQKDLQKFEGHFCL